MATYKGIQGYTVQSLSSDPPGAEAVGKLWYNSGTGTFKIGTSGAGAWASGGATNTARDAGASAGTQTAALYFGGRLPGTTKNTEKYDGTSWTEVNNLNTAREYLGGAGTQTAALAIGTLDQSPNLGCETWDGTSWTEGNNTNLVHGGGNTSGGTTTSAICAGGGWPPPSPYYHAESETYDGTCWSEGNDLTSALGALQGGSSYSAVPGAFSYGGYPAQTTYITYDGTCWSTGTAGGTTRDQGTGAGSNTAALVFAGNPGHQTNTEQFDGTSWTELADLSTGRRAASGAGTNTLGLCIAGETPPGSTKNNICEEWSEPVYTIKTVTVS
jgi:hypothetical protein